MSNARIGIISDTHGLLRPQAVAALHGVDHIIHAGDIGNQQILHSLSEIAPVVAVRGNNDKEAWAATLPETICVTLAGVTIHVLHDVKELGIDLQAAQCKVVIAGHSHRPSITEREGILFINPGSAGPRRFKLPISIAILEISDGIPQARICVFDQV